MRPHQAVARLGDSEVAGFCVSAPTISFEILVAVMADGDALFRTCAFCRWLNAPSTARSAAGLISLECAMVTENSGPSSFCCQNERKSFSAGKFGNRS